MHVEIEKQGPLYPGFDDGTCVEGFSRFHARATGGRLAVSFRPGEQVECGTAYPDESGTQVVEWETGVTPGKTLSDETVTFVWTCTLGGGRPGQAFEHRVHVNGHYVCRLNTPIGRRRTWKGRNGCRVFFDALAGHPNGEQQGQMYLTVPRALLHPGRRARIRVQGGETSEPNFSFFMLMGYRDTLRRATRFQAEGFEIAADGRAAADIVIAGSAGVVERFAAAELRRYVRLMSGADVKIRRGEIPKGNHAIVVGTGPSVRALLGKGAPVCRAHPRHDTIRIRTRNGHLVLTGANPRAVLFSVYQWLAAKGCRWIEPGAHGERIPSSPCLRAGAVDFEFMPKYLVRTSRPTEDLYFYTERDVCDQIDWMAKNGMNCAQFLIPPFERLHDVIVPEMRKRGMVLSGGGHNFRAWLPVDLFDAHPEYFAMVNGRRIPRGSIRCASSKEGVRAWARNAVAWVRAYPELDDIKISCDDGSTYCQCPGCGRLKPIDQLQIFYNAAARAIVRAFPRKRIAISSYTAHYEPSTRIPMYTKNVFVMVDLFSRCKKHPLLTAQCSCPNVQTLYSAGTPDVQTGESNRYLCLVLKKWRTTMDEITVFENSMQHYRLDTPFPYPHVLAQDIRYLFDIGVRGFAPQADLNRWAQGTLNLYVIARMVWDPDRDLDVVLTDYYARTFGPAASLIRDYDARLETLLTRHCAGRADAIFGRIPFLECLTPGLASECRRVLRRARARARDTAYQAAVERVFVLFEFSEYLWKMLCLRKEILSDLQRGRRAAARSKRRVAVNTGRAFLALIRTHAHRNLFFFSIVGAGKQLEACVNDYPFVDRRMELPRWAKQTSLGKVEHIREVCAQRKKYQVRSAVVSTDSACAKPPFRASERLCPNA